VLLRDRLLTGEEYHAMATGLADSDAPATGTVALTAWLTQHGAQPGRRYANELDRHPKVRRTGARRRAAHGPRHRHRSTEGRMKPQPKR
jgi:hypothetical protein